MKAILREDLIIKVSLTEGIEIGNIPNTVSLDRLRWDGSKIVDLANVSVIYIRHLGDNFFELHAIPQPNTQWLPMNYKQRRDLRYNSTTDTIYLAGMQVKADEAIDEEIEAIKHKLGMAFGSDNDLFLKHFAFTAAFPKETPSTRAVKGRLNPMAKATRTPDIQSVYPCSTAAPRMM